MSMTIREKFASYASRTLKEAHRSLPTARSTQSGVSTRAEARREVEEAVRRAQGKSRDI